MANLPRTVRTVREAMRIYPAAHSIGRSNTNDEVLNGYRIPAGSAIVVSPWTVHRSPKIWDNPEAFDAPMFVKPLWGWLVRMAWPWPVVEGCCRSRGRCSASVL